MNRLGISATPHPPAERACQCKNIKTNYILADFHHFRMGSSNSRDESKHSRVIILIFAASLCFDDCFCFIEMLTTKRQWLKIKKIRGMLDLVSIYYLFLEMFKVSDHQKHSLNVKLLYNICVMLE